MAKAVFTTRIDPSYDDLPEDRYHFPRTYLRQVEAALNDWIVYYEPRRAGGKSATGGRQAYFATARVTRIERDPDLEAHFYARVSDYLEFDRAVSFREGPHYYEEALRKTDGTTSKGAFGRAVREIGEAEYDEILHAGFAHVLGERERSRPAPDVPEEPLRTNPGLFDPQTPFEDSVSTRPLFTQVSRRPFRERAFSAAVKSAYLDTCAVTGLKIINGEGRSEVQAAHIRPVADAGPDSVRNGVALSATVHWMFDRGLISIEDDYRLLLANGRVPDAMSRMIGPNQLLTVPPRLELRPHRHFLKYHRDHVFKG
ncbi:MAG: HNH endonuclease [Rhodospirillales bacterium]|nr:HNH endonuclease [Rhodospirillales bacterium]